MLSFLTSGQKLITPFKNLFSFVPTLLPTPPHSLCTNLSFPSMITELTSYRYLIFYTLLFDFIQVKFILICMPCIMGPYFVQVGAVFILTQLYPFYHSTAFKSHCHISMSCIYNPLLCTSRGNFIITLFACFMSSCITGPYFVQVGGRSYF